MKKIISFFLFVSMLFSMPVYASEIKTINEQLKDDNKLADLRENYKTVYASQLEDGSINKFQEDTILFLDKDKTINEIWGENLIIRGSATLYAYYIKASNLTIESGTICEIPNADDYEHASEYSNFIAEFVTTNKLNLNGGNVILERFSGRCIQALSMNISDGRIEANSTMCALCAEEIVVSGGEVYAYSNFVGIGGYSSWTGSISGCNLIVSGGYLEVRGVSSDYHGFTIGAALSKLTMTGGTFISSGSLTALNCWDEPISLDESIQIVPSGAYVSTQKTDTEKAIYGWSGYSILNTDGTRVKELTLREMFYEDGDKNYGLSLSASWRGSDAITVQINPAAGVMLPAKLIAALYNQNGKMLEIKTVDAQIIDGETFITEISFERPVSEDITAKLFLLGREKLTPLCKSKTVSWGYSTDDIIWLPTQLIYLGLDDVEQIPDITEFNVDTDLIEVYTWEYDNYGNLNTQTLGVKDYVADTYQFFYNGTGARVKERHVNDYHDYNVYIDYAYYDDGKISMEKRTFDNDAFGVVGYDVYIYEYEYDTNGNVITEITTIPGTDTTHETVYKYTYDEHGRILSEEYEAGGWLWHYEYDYDDYGNTILSTRTIQTGNGVLSSETRTSYIYDNFKNIVESEAVTTYPDGRLGYVRRKYTYQAFSKEQLQEHWMEPTMYMLGRG